MQIDRLDIKGFKSFGDKITIHFSRHITAIVGPNGCGKSNVIDAIRWVLGEQNTRMLRSEKMDNVIFNGTKNRKASNLAEVSITFDNSDHTISLDFFQITLTRRLYRTGESEYLLNNVPCRLKDITDLFLNTGIGAGSYTIMELNMIDDIIANKEGSRRNLFEEAAEISRYRLRKKQAFNRLKDAETDLERVGDLLSEIEKNLKILESQAKKAERYYRIREQYKALSITLASVRIAVFSESLKKIEEKEERHQAEKMEIKTRMAGLEAVLQQQKLDNLNKEKNLSSQQKKADDWKEQIQAYENEMRISNEQLRFYQDKETQLTGELEKDKNQLNHILDDLQRLSAEKTKADETLLPIQLKLTDLKEAADEVANKKVNAGNELNELNDVSIDLQNQLYKTEKNIDVLQTQQQAIEQEYARITGDAANKEAKLSQVNENLAELRSQIALKEKKLQRLVEFENYLQQQITVKENELQAIQASIDRETRQLDAKKNEYKLTKSMVDNLEGFPESIRYLKKTTGWSKGTPPLFSDILFCREEYRIALESYLEPLMNHYVIDTYSEGITAIDLLSRSAQGRAHFFVLNTYEPEQPIKTDMKNITPVLSVVEVEKKYQPLCDHLLNNVYLTDDSNEHGFNNKELPDGVVLIGKSGKFIKSKYIMTGGSPDLFQGKRIGRTKNLDVLLKTIKLIEVELAVIKKRFEKLKNKLSTLRLSGKAIEIKDRQNELSLLKTELLMSEIRQEEYQIYITDSNNHKQDITLKIEGIKGEMLTLGPLLEELKKQKQIHNDLFAGKQMAFNKLNEYELIQSDCYDQENIRFHQQQNKVSGLIKDIELLDEQKRDIDLLIKQNSGEMEAVKFAIEKNLGRATDFDRDIQEMYAKKRGLEAAAELAGREYYEGRNKTSATENEIIALRRKIDHAEIIDNELIDERNNLKLELNALKERLSVAFNIDIQDLPNSGITIDQSEEDIRKKLEKLKTLLDDFGAVNPMAVEVYNEIKERYMFIQVQIKDLNHAKTSLLATIQEIDFKANEKFMASFTGARENFINVFRSLFNNEDTCDLILADPQNSLHSDIEIIAKPRGKRPLSINQLSGGEKTLTAIAVLFSLYLLKPAPFCIFDEIDAPLDDGNIGRLDNLLREFSHKSQFIIISHNKKMINTSDIIYGITMAEQGVSRVVPIDLTAVLDIFLLLMSISGILFSYRYI